MIGYSFLAFVNNLNNTTGIANHDAMGRYIIEYDCPSTNLCIITNVDSTKNDNIGANIYIVSNSRYSAGPKLTSFFDAYGCAMAQYDSFTYDYSVIYNETDPMKYPNSPPN